MAELLSMGTNKYLSKLFNSSVVHLAAGTAGLLIDCTLPFDVFASDTVGCWQLWESGVNECTHLWARRNQRQLLMDDDEQTLSRANAGCLLSC